MIEINNRHYDGALGVVVCMMSDLIEVINDYDYLGEILSLLECICFINKQHLSKTTNLKLYKNREK